MSKGVSPLYSTGPLFRVRPMWTPDPSFKKQKKKKKPAAAKTKGPTASGDAVPFHLKVRFGKKLRSALRIIEETKRAIKSLEEQISNPYHPDDPPRLLKRLTLLKSTLLQAEGDADKWRNELKALKIGTINQPKSLGADAQASQYVTEPARLKPDFLDLGVPLPTERIIPADVVYLTRDGQLEFRAMVLRAYGRCAVTGCEDTAALQAAHIIPYVNAQSNVCRNGLCLRADIHILFDRELLAIGPDYVVNVADGVVTADYRALHGKKISLPQDQKDWPCSRLLAQRHLVLSL